MAPDTLIDLFTEATEIENPADRARFLDAACGNESELRRRVERLLQAHAEAGGFLARPLGKRSEPNTNQSAAVHAPLTEKSGDRIGRYKLLKQLGQGGCG